MKRKLSRWMNKHLNADAIKMAILFLPLVYLLIKEIQQGNFSLGSFLDVGILVSFLLVAVCEGMAVFLGNFIGSKCEDATKLTEDYESLCKKYPRERFVMLGDKKCPVICLCARTAKEPPFEFEIIESEDRKRYELPAQVAAHSDEIMNAHRFSKVYNNRNVRLDDFKQDGNKVSMFYSTTMYYDSLVTNRAMDYEWGNGKTIREVYEPGPFLNSLCESKLSNHLGFNGFVETADGQLIFVMRYDKVSIGKRTLADSIGASLKTKYCLDDEKKLMAEGLDSAIRGEIEDELKIKIGDGVKMSENIFAFYRDVVEGGKPQFMFYYKTEWDSMKVKAEFRNALKEDKRKKRGPFQTDGKKLIFVSREDLSAIVLDVGSVTFPNGKKYKMMPSAVATVELLKKYFKEEEMCLDDVQEKVYTRDLFRRD